MTMADFSRPLRRRRRLRPFDGKHVSLSGDGMDLAKNKTATALWLTNDDGKAHRANSRSKTGRGEARVSPDGKWVLFESALDLLGDGGRGRPCAGDEGQHGAPQSNAIWSPEASPSRSCRACTRVQRVAVRGSASLTREDTRSRRTREGENVHEALLPGIRVEYVGDKRKHPSWSRLNLAQGPPSLCRETLPW